MIRQARPSDELAIKDCAEQAYTRYISRLGRKPAPMSADFNTQISAGDVYVAVDDKDEIQGFIVFYQENSQMLLENVAVLPLASGRGIGKAMIRFCEAAARQGGLTAVRLYTNAKMTENLTIYPKLGYREVGRRIEDGFHRVYFEKTLA